MSLLCTPVRWIRVKENPCIFSMLYRNSWFLLTVNVFTNYLLKINKQIPATAKQITNLQLSYHCRVQEFQKRSSFKCIQDCLWINWWTEYDTIGNYWTTVLEYIYHCNFLNPNKRGMVVAIQKQDMLEIIFQLNRHCWRIFSNAPLNHIVSIES